MYLVVKLNELEAARQKRGLKGIQFLVIAYILQMLHLFFIAIQEAVRKSNKCLKNPSFCCEL